MALWLERVRILHAICRTEQNSIWRGRFRDLKIVPASPREAAELRAESRNPDAAEWWRRRHGFCGLTRLALAPGGSLLTFNMERSGKPGPYLAVLKVGSLPPSPSGKSKMSVRQSAPFAAPVGLDGVFPVQREGSSLPLPVPVPAVSLRFSTWSAAESRFGGVENRSLTASCLLSLRRSSDPDGAFYVRFDGRAH